MPTNQPQTDSDIDRVQAAIIARAKRHRFASQVVMPAVLIALAILALGFVHA